MKIRVNRDENISYINIENSISFDVVLCTLGASIFSIKYNGDSMTSHPLSRDFRRNDLYHGKTIGPIANRIKDGKLEIDSSFYHQFDLNEGRNTLHGGKNGVSTKNFDYTIFEKPLEYVLVTFTLKDEDYIGTSLYTITYKIYDNLPKVELLLNVKNDTKAVYSLTNHSFFALGEKTCKNLKLMIPSDSFVITDTTDLTYQAETSLIKCLDFNKLKSIGEDIDEPFLQNSKAKGYDHCFIKKDGVIYLAGRRYTLTIESNYDSVQIYSDNYNLHCGVNNSTAQTHRGIAIEPMDNPTKLKQRCNIVNEYSRFITYTFRKA